MRFRGVRAGTEVLEIRSERRDGPRGQGVCPGLLLRLLACLFAEWSPWLRRRLLRLRFLAATRKENGSSKNSNHHNLHRCTPCRLDKVTTSAACVKLLDRRSPASLLRVRRERPKK